MATMSRRLTTFLALFALFDAVTPMSYYINQYMGSSNCLFGSSGQVLEISAVTPTGRCELWSSGPDGDVYRQFILSTDGLNITDLRLGCSDSNCSQCSFVSQNVSTNGQRFHLDECIPGVSSLDLEETDGVGVDQGSAVVYPIGYGVCLASLRGQQSSSGIYSTEYTGLDNCTEPVVNDASTTVVMRHWGHVSSQPVCTAVEGAPGLYAALARPTSTLLQGALDCTSDQCDNTTCADPHVNVTMDTCAPVNLLVGNVSTPSMIKFHDASALHGCRDPPPGPTPPEGDGRSLNYPAIVIGSTLGTFAIVWLVVSSVMCKPDRRRAMHMQGDDEGAASPLFSGSKTSSYSAIDG